MVRNKTSVLTQDFHSVLLYTGSDESGRPLQISPKLKKLGLGEKTLLEYHFDTLFKNKLYDIVIVTNKDIAKDIMKFPLSKDMIAKFNVQLHVLSDDEDKSQDYKCSWKESTVKAMQLINSQLTKDLIIFHGQYLVDLNLNDAISIHKINSADMTLVLKKQSDLDERAKKSALNEQFNVYGLGHSSNEVYAMFNSFEADDSSGLSVTKSILKKCPGARINLRSDLSDTGVYIMRNIFSKPLLGIETIDFDLVKLMVNNQYK